MTSPSHTGEVGNRSLGHSVAINQLIKTAWKPLSQSWHILTYGDTECL